jgi:hypothetical protein
MATMAQASLDSVALRPPNLPRPAVARAVHAIKWQLQHRYMQLEAMAELTPPAAGAEPRQLPPQAA